MNYITRPSEPDFSKKETRRKNLDKGICRSRASLSGHMFFFLWWCCLPSQPCMERCPYFSATQSEINLIWWNLIWWAFFLGGRMDAKNQPDVRFLLGSVFHAWKHKAHKMAYFVPPKNTWFWKSAGSDSSQPEEVRKTTYTNKMRLYKNRK